jgi:4-hydroxy-tetrahydrodipicolinate reductase
MMAEASKTYRVIQWATGNVGTRSLRRLIEHPDYELVGLYVTSDEKAGKDAARIAEKDVGYERTMPDTGVTATKSVDEIVALDADCVLYMPAYTDFDQVCRLLASGKNVVTPRGEFLHPANMDPEKRALIEKACAEGGTSLHSSGSSPGFITEAIPIPLIAQQRRLDCLTINEYADMTSRNSPDMIFNMMGFGNSPGQFNQGMLHHVKHDFSGSLIQLAEAMKLELDEITVEGEMGVANNDIQIAAGTVSAGTVAALRITVSAIHKGKPLLRFRAHWYCGTDIDKDWNLLDSGWLVQVQGDTPMDVRISFPVSEEEYPKVTPGFTAHRCVNAVPAVCDAAPGIRTTMDLPHIIATF